jgi:RNA polymerase sigma-70 factor (ECF subfamily)
VGDQGKVPAAKTIRNALSHSGRDGPTIRGYTSVALSEIDRNLLQRCLQHKPRAWEDFVDRFMGLVVHVVTHTAQARSVRLTPEDRDDLCADVFLEVVKSDFALLRNFRGQSSLATYLTVVARRIVVKELLARKAVARLAETSPHQARQPLADPHPNAEQRLSDREEVERLLGGLQGTEAQVVRMYHLEGKTYQEISDAIGMPENSIGPILSRARNKMRRAGVNPATG